MELDFRAHKICQSISGNKKQQQAMTSIQVPSSWLNQSTDMNTMEDSKTAHEFTLLTDPADVFTYVKLRNQYHYHQASRDNTPFTREPLSAHFNWDAGSPQAEPVLEGQCSDDELNETMTND